MAAEGIAENAVSDCRQQLYERESSIAILYAKLERNVDGAIADALAMLGEASVDPAKYHYHCQSVQNNLEARVCKSLKLQVCGWLDSVTNPEDVIPLFEDLRKRCYGLYDDTAAWSTVSTMARTISEVIRADALARLGGEADGLLLCAVEQLLLLLLDDAAAFQGINRGSNREVIEALEGCSEPHSKLGGALGRVGEILGMLNFNKMNDPSFLLSGWRAELVKELRAEAEALQGVYEGILHAAKSLVASEAAIRAYYMNPGTIETPTNAPIDSSSHAAVPAGELSAAYHTMKQKIQELNSKRNRWHMELRPTASERVSSLASRLDAWGSLLDSAAKISYFNPIIFTTVQIRYCFPFAVTVDEQRVRNLSAALRQRLPSHKNMDSKEETFHGKLSSALGARLRDLGHRGEPEVESLKLTELWLGAGNGMHGGVRVNLPPIVDADVADDKWAVWVELSRLENHCLCIARTLVNPTPHELYKALRCGGHYARDSKYRYQWSDQRSAASDLGRWRSVDEFAHDVILTVARALKNDCRPDYLKGYVHEVVIATTDKSIGVSSKQVASALTHRYGGGLFCVDLHRVAATLEEWLRYPIIGSDRMSNIAQTEFGYTDEWVSALDNTTIFGVVGNPSWITNAYVEVAQFAASWAPRFLLWNRRLMRALEPGVLTKSSQNVGGYELRELEHQVRRLVTVLHSDELCRLNAHRRYLDWMLSVAGITSVEKDLERRLQGIRLLIDHHENSAQKERDDMRNRFLLILALFSVFNVSTAFAVLDLGSTRGIFTSQSAVFGEVIFQALLLVIFAVILWRTWSPENWQNFTGRWLMIIPKKGRKFR